MDDFKDKNNDHIDEYDGGIYDDGDDENVPDHNYHSKDKILMVTGSGEVKYPVYDGGLYRRISEDGKCVTQNYGDDKNDINKRDRMIEDSLRGDAIEPSPSRITANHTLDIYAEEFRGGNA